MGAPAHPTRTEGGNGRMERILKSDYAPKQDRYVGLDEIMDHDALDLFPEMPEALRKVFLGRKKRFDSNMDLNERYRFFLENVVFDMKKEKWCRMFSIRTFDNQ
jgi:hypothetical protein